jgi:hypothetical protein
VRLSVLVLVVLLTTPAAACRRSPTNETHQHAHELNLPPAGPAVTVAFDGRSASVELTALLQEAGPDSVPLLTIWKAAFPTEDPMHLRFDLVGSDGFRPTSRPKCPRLLTGKEIARGHMDLARHDVSFDSDLQLPGCYRVRGVVRLEAVR